MKIEKLTKRIGDNNLEFITISAGRKTNFSKKDYSLTFLNKIKKGEIKNHKKILIIT